MTLVFHYDVIRGPIIFICPWPHTSFWAALIVPSKVVSFDEFTVYEKSYINLHPVSSVMMCPLFRMVLDLIGIFMQSCKIIKLILFLLDYYYFSCLTVWCSMST